MNSPSETLRPYPGLRPFRRDELSLFFGREEQIDQLLEKLGHSRFLGVVGISGCGKSSLVTAGLIPALQSGFLASAGARWRVATLRPGNQPMRRLATALLEATASASESAEPVSPMREALLHASLRRGPLGLVEVLEDSPLPERTNLLLLVDQFEEIFRYHEHGDREEADAFVALLLASAQQSALPIYVVLTMRSDFLGACALFNGLPEALNDSQFLTPRLAREQRRASILGPGHVFGARVEPALVNRLLNDMGEAPDQLPLMQHVLMRLWDEDEEEDEQPDSEAGSGAGSVGRSKHLTLEDYRRVGGFRQALSRHLEEAYTKLTDRQKKVAQIMFRALTERGGGQADTRRPATLGEVAVVGGFEPEEVAAVVEVFRAPGRSFMTPPVGVELTEETVLDISHESLIRQWPRMLDWVERESISAGLYTRLAETASLWKTGKAGLWGAPDLDFALSWRELSSPTAAWAERYGGQFELATEFLDASVEQRREQEEAAQRAEEEAREQLRVKKRSIWLALGLGFAMILALLAAWEAWLLRRSGQEERVNLLLSQSLEALGEYPQHSLLLAAEALDQSRKAKTGEEYVRQVLQEALTNVGGDPLVGHTDGLSAVATSPDGRWIATGSSDSTVLLWPQNEWKFGGAPPEPIVLAGHSAPVNVLAFGVAGKYLATGGEDRKVRLWDVSGSSPVDEPVAVLESHDSGVTSIAFSADGRWLAAGVYDRVALLWDLSAPSVGARVLTGHVDVINALVFGPESRWLVTASADNSLRRWDLPAIAAGTSTGTGGAGAEVASATVLEGHRGPVLAVAVSSDGRWLASGGADNTAQLWELEAENPSGSRIELIGAKSSVASVAFSADGRWLATGSSDKKARLWDLSTGGPLPRPLNLEGHDGPIVRVAISPDSRWLVTASRDKTARLWNLESEEPEVTSKVLRIHAKPLTALAISPDSRWLVTASADRTARRWSLQRPIANSMSAILPGHEDTVRHLVLAPDGRWMASGSDDNTARIWRLGSNDPGFHPRVLRGHVSSLLSMTLSPDRRWLVTGSDDNTARLWDLEAEDPSASAKVLRGHASSVFSVDFHPEGRYLATGSSDGTVRLWEPLGGSAAVRVLAAGDLVGVVRFSPDGEQLAAAGADGVVRLWDRAAWEPGSASEEDARSAATREFQGHTAPIPAIAYSLDSQRLYSASWDATARVWDTSAGGSDQPIAVLRGHHHAINTLALSPDGSRLATAGADATVRLWPAGKLTPRTRGLVLEGHQDAVLALAFSKQGRWLLSGSADESARLWDLDAKNPSAGPGILLGHRGPVTVVAFGPGGAAMLTGSEDDDARYWKSELWQLESEELLARACRVAGRNLTRSEWARLLPGQRYHEICPGLPVPSAHLLDD